MKAKKLSDFKLYFEDLTPHFYSARLKGKNDTHQLILKAKALFKRVKFPREITIRIRWLLLIIPLLMLWPQPGQIVYSDPILNPSSIKPLKAIKMPSESLVEPLETALYPLAGKGTYSNDYAWGNCTEYVASRIPVPNSMGNAISWGYVLGAEGYTISDTPKVGSIAWSVSDSYLGHVAIVEAVDDGQAIISEANYNGLGYVDTRPANPGEFRYIYY